MQITKIETFTYWIEWCNWLFVKVSTDEGLVGWGVGSGRVARGARCGS